MPSRTEPARSFPSPERLFPILDITSAPNAVWGFSVPERASSPFSPYKTAASVVVPTSTAAP